MFAASQVARAILLKHGEFPPSGMELPTRLQSRSPGLAGFLSRLTGGGGRGLDPDALRHGEALVKQETDRLRSEADAGGGDARHKNLLT